MCPSSNLVHYAPLFTQCCMCYIQQNRTVSFGYFPMQIRSKERQSIESRVSTAKSRKAIGTGLGTPRTEDEDQRP